jgi:hypothetical protein
VSVLFKAYIEEKISYDDFLEASFVLRRLSKTDFYEFTEQRDSYYFDLSDVGDLINSGLFGLDYEEIDVRVEENQDHKLAQEKQKYRTDVDGGVSVHLTHAGKIILEVFCPNYKKPKNSKI